MCVEPAKTEEARIEETKPEATTEPAKETVTKETPKGSVTIEKGPEPLITIILQNAEIEDVLFLIAENTGIDISVESRSIKGKISLKVTRKPVSEVFNLIATQGNFKWNKYNDIYIFGSEQFIWSFPGVIKPKVVRLKYSDPMKVRQVLTQMRLGTANNVTLYQAPNISGTGGRLNVPTAQDAIVLKGDEKLIAQMLDVIRQIDVPPLLIKVNMKVIEYSLTDNKNIGFNWKNVTGGGTLDKGVISFNLQEKFNATEGELPLQGFKRGSSIDFNMVFNYLLDQGSAKILADSTLNVTNGGRGEFFVGEKIPYRSTFQVSDFGRVTQRIQNEDVGISMRFKAQAADDNMITLYLDPDLTNLKEITDIGPRTSKKNFTTTVRIQSGQAYAIGGLINESDRVTYDKVPFLGDLPLLGKFFKSKNTQKNRSELIVIFTPEIVRDAAVRMYDMTNEDQYPVEGNTGSSFSLSN